MLAEGIPMNCTIPREVSLQLSQDGISGCVDVDSNISQVQHKESTGAYVGRGAWAWESLTWNWGNSLSLLS
jgi:hypothetical protein